VTGKQTTHTNREIAEKNEARSFIVLPPARPKYNGGVERGNRTFREEFYACRDLIADSIGAMRFDLRKAVEKYNTFRPHHALNGTPPMEYLRNTQAEAA
jgi:putative transposase